MEIASFVVAVLAVIASGAAALYALGANRRADEANRTAEEALKVQRAALPPVWSAVEAIGEGTMAFRNQSSRTIEVLGITVEPDEAAQLIGAPPRPHTVEYGDFLALQVRARYMSQPAHRIFIEWRYEGEADVRKTMRQV
ncbi:hypothetical protein [Microbacterium sp. LMC-P-041]|uniref:hypothetical protein n=1 Tax=Microbacterium sp. LMC-P-041 TaxID=3040293 RepID=UPI00255734BA|nr:hypothetical protein [Microbacterium sp. LMC-P-041]